MLIWSNAVCSVSSALQEAHHERQVSSFLQDHGNLYQDVKFIGPEEEMDGAAPRNLGLWVSSTVNLWWLFSFLFPIMSIKKLHTFHSGFYPQCRSSLYIINVPFESQQHRYNNRSVVVLVHEYVSLFFQWYVPKGRGLWLFLQLGHWSGFKKWEHT